MSDYLVCTGIPISLKDFVQDVFNQLNLDVNEHVKIDNALLRSLDLEMIYGDNTKAKAELGWEYGLTHGGLVKQLLEDETRLLLWEMETGIKL